MQKLYTELSAYALELYMGQFSTPSTVVDSEGKSVTVPSDNSIFMMADSGARGSARRCGACGLAHGTEVWIA